LADQPLHLRKYKNVTVVIFTDFQCI